MKDQWTVETERMKLTLVSEPMPVAKALGRTGPAPGFEPPLVPTYVLITRAGGSEPVRVEAEDAELLMWVLLKLGASSRIPRPHGDFGALG